MTKGRWQLEVVTNAGGASNPTIQRIAKADGGKWVASGHNLETDARLMTFRFDGRRAARRAASQMPMKSRTRIHDRTSKKKGDQ